MNRTLIAFCTTALLLVPAGAMATSYDISLTGFIDQNGNQDTQGFKAVAQAVALAMQPRWAGPASTMGSRGFDIAYNFMHTSINPEEAHWKLAVPDRTLRGLQTSQVHFRKGLPFSLELGGTVSKLLDSRLYGVGFELKLAPVESYRYAPDLGARFHANTILGSRDLSIFNWGGDFLASKSFGLWGVVQTTPFVGFSMGLTHARSHVLGVIEPGSVALKTDVIDEELLLFNRLILGLAVHASWVELGFEATLPTTGAGNTVPTYTTRVGLQF